VASPDSSGRQDDDIVELQEILSDIQKNSGKERRLGGNA